MNGDELVFYGPMSQLETDRWIQNMEDHMENNPIAGTDMTQHALQCFGRGATNLVEDVPNHQWMAKSNHLEGI